MNMYGQLEYVVNKLGFNESTLEFFFQEKGKVGIETFKFERFKHPITLRLGSSDIWVFHEVLMHEQYALHSEIKPKVIFDCGANIGLTTIYYKNLYPKAKIICFEPETKNYELLTKNTQRYGQSIIRYKAGVWNKDTYLSIINTDVDNWSFMVEETETEKPDSIKALSIESVMKDHQIETIDILKIDIEGSEKELFESNYEYWLPRTKTIIIELHEFLKEGCNKAFFNAVLDNGFNISFRGDKMVICTKK